MRSGPVASLDNTTEPIECRRWELHGGDGALLRGGDGALLRGGDGALLRGGDGALLRGGDGALLRGGDGALLRGGDGALLRGGDGALLRGGDGALLRGGDLGEPVDDATLLADPALSEDANEETLRLRGHEGAPGAVSCIARLRLAGRSGRIDALLALAGAGPAWTRTTRGGDVTPLTHWRARLAELAHALDWGVPASEALGELAARLFRASRPRTALDLVDAARLTSDAPALREARIAYLRALGRDAEALRELETAHPDRVNAREETLILGLRAPPGDRQRWLAYAEAMAEARPAHAALIRSACGTEDADWLEALLSALHDAPGEDLGNAITLLCRSPAVLSTVWVEAEQFLAHHDALFRAAPLATELGLSEAMGAMAQVATLPCSRPHRSPRSSASARRRTRWRSWP
jgi:hypothetical protein